MTSSVNEKRSLLTYLYIFLTNSCLFYTTSFVAIKTHSFQILCNFVNKAIISYIFVCFAVDDLNQLNSRKSKDVGCSVLAGIFDAIKQLRFTIIYPSDNIH